MTPPASAVSTRPPLRRASDDRLVLGVCAGVARSLDLAPLAVRLLAVALAAVAAPLVLALYVVLAAIVPRDDGRVLLGGAPADQREALTGWSLIALTLVWFAAEDFQLGGLVWPALSSFGVFAAASAALVLLALTQRQAAAVDAPAAHDAAGGEATRDAAGGQAGRDAALGDDAATASDGAASSEAGRDVTAPGAAAGDAPRADLVHRGGVAPGPAADVDPALDGEVAAGGGTARPNAEDTAIDGDAVTMQFAPRPPRRGPSLGVIGLGVLLIASAVGFLLDATGEIDLSAAAVAVGLGTGAALAGAGAIAGALSRRRGVAGLLVLGVLLGGAAASVALLETELDDGVGLRTERPLTTAEIPDAYRLGAGELDVDLRDTELPAGPTTIRAHITAGVLEVHVPPGVRVASVGPTHVDGVERVNADLKPGPLPENKRRAAKERRARARAEAARPIVRIDADVREGDAEVFRLGG